MIIGGANSWSDSIHIYESLGKDWVQTHGLIGDKQKNWGPGTDRLRAADLTGDGIAEIILGDSGSAVGFPNEKETCRGLKILRASEGTFTRIFETYYGGDAFLVKK